MTTLDWGLAAAGVLLFVFAARALVSKDGKDQLGCGFGLAAAVLWTWLLKRWVPDFDLWSAGRLALGGFLLLPGIRAIAKPKGNSILAGAVALVLAVVIAGPVVQRLWSEHNPASVRTEEEGLAHREAQVTEQIEEVAQRRDVLAEREQELTAWLQQSGVTTETLAENAEARTKLSALAQVRELRAQHEQALAQLEQLRDQIRAQREELAAGESTEPPASPTADLEALLDSLESGAAEDDDASALELYQQQQELQRLLEDL